MTSRRGHEQVKAGEHKIALPSHPEGIQRLATLGEALRDQFPEILALYLFGSTARGCASATSDVDLAIFTDPGKPLTTCPSLSSYGVVTRFLQTDQVDLLWLNQAPLLLQWEVVRTGKLLFARDEVAVAEFVETVTRDARDASTYARLCQTWYRTFLTQAYLHNTLWTLFELVHRRVLAWDLTRKKDPSSKIDCTRSCQVIFRFVTGLQFAYTPVEVRPARKQFKRTWNFTSWIARIKARDITDIPTVEQHGFV